MTSLNGYTFGWTNRRLTSATSTDNNVSYTYNHNGIRTSKTVNGTTITYKVDENNNVIEQTDGTNTIKFVYDSNNAPIYFIYNNLNYYYEKNLQGDIVAILDTNGNTVVEYTYDIWGKLLGITGELADTVGVTNPLRYRGYYYDTETALYYLQSRYYSPDLMRFISQDDVKHSNEQGQPLGSNLYAYCLNNPTNKKDPSGEMAISTCILIGSIVVGVLAFGHTAAVSYKYTGKIDWSSAILNGLSWFSLAYSYGTTAYGIYLNYCDYKGLTPTTEVNFNKTQTSLQKCANSVQSSTKGHVSGTKQHTAFAKKVNTLKNKNLKTEVSYKNGKVVKYGTKGSVRLDVVEYDKKGRIVSVYDLKTGNAKLSQKQIKNIQKHLPGKDVIITEIKPQKR